MENTTLASETSQKSKPFIVCCYCLNDSNRYNKYYFISDEKGVFEKMIEDTFNIQISYLKSLNKMICLECCEEIRNAAEAKKKILDVQKKLLEQNEKFVEIDCDSLKQEIPCSGEKYESEDRGSDDMDKVLQFEEDTNNATSDIDTKDNEKNAHSKEVTIKIEPMDINEIQTQPEKRKNTSRILSQIIRESPLTITEETKHVTKKKICRKTEGKPILNREPRINSDDLKFMKINTMKLLFNSNMLLFISKRTKFACYTCKESYFDIRLLRQHSISHSVEDSVRNDLNRCRGMSYKNVDISNLTCTKCSNQCRDLNDLREHLTTEHGEVFENAEHLLLPFKLEEGFKCVICQETFFTFCRLSIHMNSHSTSNFCETCGVAYTNRKSLRNHINSTHTKKKCSKCSSVFATSSAKTRHLRKAHNMGDYKRYCLKCEMTFRYTYQLAEHMIAKHGAKRQVSVCEHCSKEFPSPGAVKIHIRAVHVGERNYPCSICEMSFFTSYDKRRHERSHADEKSFSCRFCEVKFKTKDSLRRHLKRQHAVT